MKNVLNRVLNVVKFLATRVLAFRGSDKKVVLKQTKTFDPFLAEHLVIYENLGSGKTAYLSRTIYEELTHFMGKEVFSFIVKKIKGRK